MTTAVLLQAHLGSTRLPKKVLLPLGDMSIIEHCICTACQSIVDSVIVCTTSDSSNNELIEHIETFKHRYPKLKVYRSHSKEDNVLERYYNCSKEFDISTIIRITSDCCIHSPHIINTCLKVFRIKLPDFLFFGDIDGWDTQIVSFEALEKVHKEATEKHHLEHVFPYIYENKDKFRIINLKDIKLSIDYAEDYGFVQKLFV